VDGSLVGDEFVTRQEAAELLGVNVRTIDRYTQESRLQRYMRLNRIVYKREDVEALNEPVPVAPMPDKPHNRDWL
jgi:hypothetical protein